MKKRLGSPGVRRVSWILLLVFLWTTVGMTPVSAAVDTCKQLRAEAMPQARDLSDTEMAKIVGGTWPLYPYPCTSCYCNVPVGSDLDTQNGALILSRSVMSPSDGGSCSGGGCGGATSYDKIGSVGMTIYYDSMNTDKGAFGCAWTHSYSIVLTEDPSENTTAQVRVIAPNGSRLYFTADNPDWKTSDTATFTPVGGVRSRLAKQAGVFSLYTDASPSLMGDGEVVCMFLPVASGTAKLGKLLVPNDPSSASDDLVTSLEYNSGGYLSGVVDAAGNRATVVYNANNLVQYVESPGGIRTTFSYTANPFPTITYDLTTIVYPTEPGQPGTTVGYTYDLGHKITQRTFGGATKSYIYGDSSATGRLVVAVDELGNRTSFEYTPSTGAVQRTIITDPAGVKTTFENNYTSGNVLPMYRQDAAGNRTTFSYDSMGRVRSKWYMLDGQSCTESYDYDTLVQKVSTVTYQPSGTSRVLLYYPDGDLKAKINEMGEATTYTYDDHRRATIEDPTHAITTWVYATTAVGPVSAQVTRDAGACSECYTYWTTGGGAGQIKTVIDAVGNVTTRYYDDSGRLISSQKSPGGGVVYTTTTSYDSWGRKRFVTQPNGTTVEYRYDCCHIISVMDENGNVTSYDYWADGSTKEVRDAENHVTQTSHGYDSASRRSWETVTNAEMETTTSTYDARKLLQKREYPDHTSEIYTYEESGQPKSRTDRDGRTTTYSYNSRGLLTRADYPNDTDLQYVYDSAGRCLQMTDGSGETSYTYYAGGRPNSQRIAFAGTALGSQITTYTYYPDGTKKSTQLPGSAVTTYHYDAAGRLSWLTNAYGEETTYAYDGVNRVVRRGVDNGAHTSYEYDSRGRILSVRNMKRDGSTILSSFSYYYADNGVTDNTGNILKIVRRLSDGNVYTASFAYDHVYRLIYEGCTGPTPYGYSYTYDSMGNRLTLVTNGGARTTYAYNADSNSRLTSEQSGATTISYTYDARGNTLSKTATGSSPTSYSYDDNSRLVRVDYPAATSTLYRYDGSGRRVRSSSVDGTTRYMIYDGNDLVRELDGAGSVVADYTYGPGRGLISVRRNSQSYYLGCDHLGTAWNVVTLDTGESIAATYSYTAFGSTTVAGGDATGNRFRYVGALGYYDEPDSGLMLLGARYYNPVTGRFQTLDPSQHGSNWYVYVNSRPTGYVDPMGLDGYGGGDVGGCFNIWGPIVVCVNVAVSRACCCDYGVWICAEFVTICVGAGVGAGGGGGRMGGGGGAGGGGISGCHGDPGGNLGGWSVCGTCSAGAWGFGAACSVCVSIPSGTLTYGCGVGGVSNVKPGASCTINGCYSIRR